MPDPAQVHAAFAARPRAPLSNDPRWDTWLLPRVDGQFTGTTDEIFQWAACKWGLPDNVLRAQAVRESMWFQSRTSALGACVVNNGCTDVFSSSSAASVVYCDGLATLGGYDYQRDFAKGICPKTFGIVSAMSWQDPAWGAWPDNQNGTFPFNRDSTAFVVDYLGAYLRGCYEGWAWWLTRTSGDLGDASAPGTPATGIPRPPTAMPPGSRARSTTTHGSTHPLHPRRERRERTTERTRDLDRSLLRAPGRHRPNG